MQQYIKDYLKSRNLDEWDDIACELCHAQAVEIHHIESSYRWQREHKKDWSDLIAVCRSCHCLIHSWNNFDTRIKLLAIVEKILNKLHNK
jgi:predicted HNH restriction endonuclease